MAMKASASESDISHMAHAFFEGFRDNCPSTSMTPLASHVVARARHEVRALQPGAGTGDDALAK
jgi:hypothetical protein